MRSRLCGVSVVCVCVCVQTGPYRELYVSALERIRTLEIDQETFHNLHQAMQLMSNALVTHPYTHPDTHTYVHTCTHLHTHLHTHQHVAET